MLVKVSQDSQLKRSLMQKENVHLFIEVAISSCGEQDSQSSSVLEMQSNAKDATVILYNLGNFDKSKFYIPGETAKQEKDRKRFLLWGGLLALYYIGINAKIKDVVEFCEATKLTSLDIQYQEDLMKTLKVYLDIVEDVKPKETDSGGNLKTDEQDFIEITNSQEEGGQVKIEVQDIVFPR